MYVVHIYIRKTLAFSRSKKTYPRGAIEPRFDRVSNFFSRFALDYYSRRFLILNERRMKDVVKKSCVLVAGYRETAFAFAISAAGVAHSVARACSMGRLLSCGCDPSSYKGKPPSKARGTQWKWGGCSHNLDYGMEFSRQFLDTRERAGDIQSTVNLHNNQAGRLVSRLINLPFHPPSPSPTLSVVRRVRPSALPPSTSLAINISFRDNILLPSVFLFVPSGSADSPRFNGDSCSLVLEQREKRKKSK